MFCLFFSVLSVGYANTESSLPDFTVIKIKSNNRKALILAQHNKIDSSSKDSINQKSINQHSSNKVSKIESNKKYQS